MPAVTRNQMKNSKNINSVNVPIINLMKDVVSNDKNCSELIARIKSLLSALEIQILSKQTRIICATTIYSLLNKEMMKHERFYKSNKFILTVYNKSFELENQANEETMEVDKNLAKKLINELTIIRPTMEGLIINMEDNVSYQTYLDKARL